VGYRRRLVAAGSHGPTGEEQGKGDGSNRQGEAAGDQPACSQALTQRRECSGTIRAVMQLLLLAGEARAEQAQELGIGVLGHEQLLLGQERPELLELQVDGGIRIDAMVRHRPLRRDLAGWSRHDTAAASWRSRVD